MSPQEISYWFSKEVKPHEGALRGYLYHRVDKPADIDDIIQESYRRIVEVRREKPVPSPRGLLFSIARNLHLDQTRKKSFSQTFLVAEMDDYNVIDEGEAPNEVLSNKDEMEVLKSAIRTLPPKCRQVLILRKFENQSHQEIANCMNITVHTVEAQLTKGLKKCRKYFERQGLMQRRNGKNGHERR